MTAARAIVLLVAAACASAAQAETLREQVAATLGATTLCQANPCPSGFNYAVNGVCCSGNAFNTCVTIGGMVTGSFICGTENVQCTDLTSLPACSGPAPAPSARPSGTQCNLPPVLLAAVGTLVAAML